jgi:hypothetical protein
VALIWRRDAAGRLHRERGAFATAAPFAWYGGKQRLAARIAALLPPHRTYVEAFGVDADVGRLRVER